MGVCVIVIFAIIWMCVTNEWNVVFWYSLIGWNGVTIEATKFPVYCGVIWLLSVSTNFYLVEYGKGISVTAFNGQDKKVSLYLGSEET